MLKERMSSVRATHCAPTLLYFEIFVERRLGKEHCEMNQSPVEDISKRQI